MTFQADKHVVAGGSLVTPSEQTGRGNRSRELPSPTYSLKRGADPPEKSREAWMILRVGGSKQEVTTSKLVGNDKACGSVWQRTILESLL